MSAYLVNPEQIGLLAAFAASSVRDNDVIPEFRTDGFGYATNAESCAAALADSCVESLKVRYPNDVSGGRPGPCLTDEDYVRACVWFARYYYFKGNPVDMLSIIKMAQCYDYQACEVNDYATSLVKKQTNWIMNKALRQMAGYEDATRDYCAGDYAWTACYKALGVAA